MGKISAMATALEQLAAKAEIPTPPPGWPAQARYDYLVQFQQRAAGVMDMLPKPSVYGAVGDVLKASDDFQREFRSQSSSIMSIVMSGANVATSFGMGKFLAFLWVVYLGAQRGMSLHLPAYQQATLQSGTITATLLDYDYRLRLGAFYLLVKAADAGMLNPLFAVKAGHSQNGLGEPIVLSTGVILLAVAVVLIIAFVIVGLYLVYENNERIKDACKKTDPTSQQLCHDLAMQQGGLIADAAAKASQGIPDIINAIKWVGIAYVAVMFAPPLIAAISSAMSSRRATA